MPNPTLDLFLAEIAEILKAHDGAKLKEYLVLEPPLPDIYRTIASELRQSFSNVSPSTSNRLVEYVEKSLPEYDASKKIGGTCDRFNIFLANYLIFIRDVEQRDVATIFKSFRSVIHNLSIAMGDTYLGSIMVETGVAYCDMLAKFTRLLERSPEQLTSLIMEESIKRSDQNPVTLTGLAVESISPIFQKCAAAVYTVNPTHSMALLRIANICLGMCLRSGDLNSLDQIISAIEMKSLPLSRYPLPQRATYLYYLGRYWFAYNHFTRAQAALQQAFNWTPTRFQKQRTQILIYLMATSIILGRFPSPQLFQRPEAASLRPHFEPLCRAIRHADLPKFRSLVNLRSTNPADAATALFFLRRKVLLPLRHRCEVLLTRQIFHMYYILAGSHGSQEPGRGAPTFNLPELRDLIVRLEKRSELQSPQVPQDQPEDDGYYSDSAADVEDEPSLMEVEVSAVSLIGQGLISGTVIHGLSKVMLKTRDKNPKKAGFPRVWDVTRRTDDPSIVPGWKRG